MHVLDNNDEKTSWKQMEYDLLNGSDSVTLERWTRWSEGLSWGCQQHEWPMFTLYMGPWWMFWGRHMGPIRPYSRNSHTIGEGKCSTLGPATVGFDYPSLCVQGQGERARHNNKKRNCDLQERGASNSWWSIRERVTVINMSASFYSSVSWWCFPLANPSQKLEGKHWFHP